MRLISTIVFIATSFYPLVRSARAPLSYAPTPEGIYTLPKNNTPTLLDVIKSRPELSTLVNALDEPAGISSPSCIVIPC